MYFSYWLLATGNWQFAVLRLKADQTLEQFNYAIANRYLQVASNKQPVANIPQYFPKQSPNLKIIIIGLKGNLYP